MNYIVFDLEWNQCPEGKWAEEKDLPFEIIEIGAVKLDENKRITDSFQEFVRPQVYKGIHAKTKEVIQVEYTNLMKGRPFPEAVKDFLNWCGENYIFCTWGNQDLMELQRNMRYYHMLELLPGPITYYDVQKMFSIQYEDGKVRCSLEHGIDHLRIEKNLTFHKAVTDAYYTAEVIQKMDFDKLLSNSSIDVYQNPKKKKDEIYISYPTYQKYVSREFSSKEKAMKDREVTSSRCPKCGLLAKRKVKWFSVNAKQYYCLAVCPEHGFIKGKVRMKRTQEDMFYAIKTLKPVGTEEAKLIQEKQEQLRRKRRSKRQGKEVR